MTEKPAPDSVPSSEANFERHIQRRKSVYLKREPLSADMIEQLRDHEERTGVGAMRLLRGAKDKPAGLNATIVGHWLRGTAQKAVPSHVAYVMERWATWPANKRMPLTSKMRAQLRAEFLRTGMGPVRILKRAGDVPPGLTRYVIQGWLSDALKPDTVGEVYWNYVMRRLGALPNVSRTEHGWL